MPSCAFLKCKNNNRNQNKSKGITFHTFPRDAQMRKSWIDIIRLSRRDEEWEAKQFSRICSDHFDESDIYLTLKGFRKIKKTACPIFQDSLKTTKIFLPSSSPNSSLVSIPISMPELNSTKNKEFHKKINSLTRENKIFKNKIKSLRKKQKMLQKFNLLLKSSLQEILGKTESQDKDSSLTLECKNMVYDKPQGLVVETKSILPRRRGLLRKTKNLPSLKKMASTINFYSPAAYKYVRRVFGLVITRPRKFNYLLDIVRQNPVLLVNHFKV